MKKKIIIGLLLISLFSCTVIKEGTIIDKWYVEGKLVNTIRASTGISTSGNVVIINTPVQEWKEEQWLITIENVVDGKTKRKTFQINEPDFNRLKIGDYWISE